MPDKNTWVTIIATLVLAIYILTLRFLPELVAWNEWDACGTECNIRAWLDALSGWVAAAIALPTVFAIGKQLAQANRHHRENAALQTLSRKKLAERVRDLASLYDFSVIASKSVEFADDALKERNTFLSSAFALEVVIRDMNKITTLLRQPVFDQFEDEIGSRNERARYYAIEGSERAAELAQRHADTIRNALQTGKGDPWVSKRKAIGLEVVKAETKAVEYRKSLAIATRAYLADPTSYWNTSSDLQ